MPQKTPLKSVLSHDFPLPGILGPSGTFKKFSIVPGTIEFEKIIAI